MDVYGAVMEHFRPRGDFTLDDARRWFRRAGYVPSGAASACSDLAALGYLHQLGLGSYRFRCQGLDDSWPEARARLNNMPHRVAWKNLNHRVD